MDLSLVDGEKDSVFFCGNSLGLQPKEAQTLVMQEMEKWQQMYECWLKLHDLQLFNKWNFVYKLALGILRVFICKSKIALRLLWCCLAVLRGLLIFCFHFCVSTTLMESKKQSWHPQVYFLRLMAACKDSLREKGGGGGFPEGCKLQIWFRSI